MSVEDIASQSRVIFEHDWKDPISGVDVSQDSAETLVRRDWITIQRSIAYSLSNISTKNYQNRLMCIEIIVCNVSVVFRDTVYIARSASLLSGLNDGRLWRALVNVCARTAVNDYWCLLIALSLRWLACRSTEWDVIKSSEWSSYSSWTWLHVLPTHTSVAHSTKSSLLTDNRALIEIEYHATDLYWTTKCLAKPRV